MNTSVAAQNNFCPFLGLQDDHQSLMAYISPQNCCYRCKPIVSVDLDQQNNYCLGAAYGKCPVYNREVGKPLPRALQFRESQRSVRSGSSRIAVISVILIVLITAGIWINSRKSQSGLMTSISPASAIVQSIDLPTNKAPVTDTPRTLPVMAVPTTFETPGPTFTLTVSPFPSLTPTSSSATSTQVEQTTATGLSARSLEVPIGRGQAYLIHRIISGENLPILAQKYQTSAEALTAINFKLTVPIWAESLIVIPLGVIDPAGLPIFEPFQIVDDQITPEALAGKLSFDVEAFKSFNDLTSDEKLQKGDWVLIPHDSQK
jgi:hypothetical protein